MTWRERAQPVIARVISDSRGCTVREVKRRLRAVYPFGERSNYPYKAWLDECARQLGEKPPLGTRRPKPPVAPDPNQEGLRL